MTCPRCKCQTCRDTSKAAMQAVLRSHVSRETSVEEQNTQTIRLATEQSAWRDTYVPQSRRFLLPREPGKPLVDPDAEQLAIELRVRA